MEKIICQNCKKELEKDEVIMVDNQVYCDDCDNELFFVCEYCETKQKREDNENYVDEKYVCESCYIHFPRCIGCDNRHFRINMAESNNEYVCDECRDDYYICDGCSDWVHQDNAYFTRDDRTLCHNCYQDNNNILADYHSGEGRADLSQESQFKIGIEIEKEDADGLKWIENKGGWSGVLGFTGWICEEDGSLDSGTGFEVISPIYDLFSQNHKKELKKIEKLINCQHSSSCGGHIHISDTKRNPQTILEDIGGYLPLLYSLYPSRIETSWSEAKKKNEYRSNYHSQAMNITDNTLEFRIFSSPDSISTILWRIKLLQFFLKNPEKNSEKVLENLQNKNHFLFNHLKKVYSDAKIKEKIKMFIDFAYRIDQEALQATTAGKTSKTFLLHNLISKNYLLCV